MFWASVCVFVTTYNLILPAISVEKDKTDNVSGLYLEDAEEIDEAQSTHAEHVADDIVTDAPTINMQETSNGGPEEAVYVNELSAIGETYEIFVTYDDKAGIPDSARLEVQEITQDVKASKSGDVTLYDEYIDSTADMLGCDAGLISYARIFDISIMDELGQEVQPAEGTAVGVRIELHDNECENVSVVHFSDESNEGEVVDNTTDGQAVEFTAEGFSVYVIAEHEGGEIITPRVEFHFLDSDYTETEEGSTYTYSAGPYTFVNKAGEYQTSQILKDGEGLEQITNPRNKTNPDRYFYGWYVVDSDSDPDVTPTVYTWTENPEKVLYETPISISIEGSTVSWSLGEASGTGTVDNDGCVHVYLAPIYEDYYFVNFHIGPKEDIGTEEEPGLAHSLMTRKLIVLGSDGQADIRIGNVQAPSPDAVHKIFAGWETIQEEEDEPVTDQVYYTLDLSGNEISNREGEEGYFITATEKKDIDLYPVYSEARWVYFHTGKSGNGATYVGAKYLLTSDDVQEDEENPYYFESLPVSQRNGYEFKGWYIAADSEENGTGDQLTDENGDLVDNFVKYDTDGTTKLYEIKDGKIYFYKAMTDLHLYAKWEEVEDSSFNVIIWRQKVTDNKNASDSEKTYDYVESETIACKSGWTLQQIIDSGKLNGYLVNGVNGKYTGFTYRTTDMSSDTVKGDKTTVVNIYYDRNLMTINWRNGNNSQSVPAYVYTETDSNTGELYGWVNGQYVPLTSTQGTDRHTYIYSPVYSAVSGSGNGTYYGIVDGQYVQLSEEPQYGYDFSYNRYEETTSNTGTQYALVDGEYVELTRVDSTTYTWTPRYTYTASNSANQTMYGIVDGSYVPLTREQTRFYVTSTNEAWPGTRYVQANDDNGTQYGIVGGQLVQLTRSGNWYSGYSWSYNGQAYNGNRYKVSTANNNTFAFVNGQMLGVTRAGSNFYYYTYNGEVYSTYRNDTTYGGTRYTRANYSGSALPEGTARYKLNGTSYAGTTDNDGTQYYYDGAGYVELVRNGTTMYSWQFNNDGENIILSDSDTRYVSSSNSTDYSGQRFIRTGNEWWNYTYEATDEEIDGLYGIDDRGGHVLLDRSQVVTGYKYYYDGAEYTRTRYIKNDTSNTYTGTRYSDAAGTSPTSEHGSGQYGRDANGVIVELVHSSSPTYSFTYTDEDGVSHTYTGKRYTRTTQNVTSFTGLYGQRLEQNGYTWPSNYTWYSGTNSSGSRLTFLDAFLFEGLSGVSSNNTVLTLYRGNSQTGGNVYFYKQNLDGSWSSEPVNSVQTSGGNFSITNKYAGFTAYQYKTGTYSETGWTTLGSPSGGSYGSVSSSNNLRIRFRRNSYNLTFDTNYPYDTVIYFDDEQWTPGEYSGDIEETREENLLYEAPLNEYGSTGSHYWEPKAPDHYFFDGWYEDATCTVPFNFDSTMPAANKVVYAKWTPETFRVHINPNGAEIDHINHNGNPTFRSDLDYYYDDKATYINADYGTVLSEYTLTREYVPISNAVAQTMDEGDVYYYIYSKYYEDTGRGLPADLRNALYAKESELDSYYQYYVDLITSLKATNPERYNEVTILGPAAWRNAYVSTQQYRRKYQNEHYEFLGWFKNDETMPYNFSDPVEESFTLTAHWRLDGGYSVMYIPEFITPDGTHINGNIEIWQDPQGGASYADQAATTILQQPTALTVNGTPVDDDSYIFRGWQLVSIGGTTENPIYTPLENGVYYQEGDEFVIEAKNANAAGIIYLQAVYEQKETSYRRPEIANLTMDANSGFITENGETELENNKNLDKIGDVGTVAVDAENDQIVFGDLQSNIAVHVDDYAEDPNYFKHPNGYVLLGFDNESDEGDFAATYAADSIISVQRTDEETIYAVWEPMVYINFVNDTNVGDVTFGLSSTDSSALYVVNEATGTYNRVAVTDLGNITVKDGETLKLAIPYGAEKDISITGTNTLGPGQVLLWDSKVTIEDSTYDTMDNITTEYSHTVDDDVHSHQLAKGQKDNNEEFSFNESLIVNETGVTVTFRAIQHDRTLVLHDNYRENTQEVYFSNPLSADGFDLPTPSTRIGYEFVGWDTERLPDNTSEIPDYPVGTDIGNVSEFFGEEQIETLYAVWKAKAERGETYVYKMIPEPGNQNKEFIFTVSIAGSYLLNSNNSQVTISSANNTSGNQLTQSFTLTHGQYLMITTSKYVGTANADGRPWIQAVVEKFDAGDSENPLETKTVRWERNSNVRGTVTFDNYAFINVTENDYHNEFYDTDIEIAAETQERALTAAQAERRVSWTNTDAGGTVFYNNIRQTSDVSVKKNLVGNATVGSFTFSASYMLDNETTDLGTFTVTSNSETGHTLEGIPVGAYLTISEAEDHSYNVSAAFENGSTDTAQADNTVTFTIPNGGETITYTNELKSYPVKILKVDQAGNSGVEARFDLSKDGANIVSGKYTTPTDNTIYNGSLYVGAYTLTETWTQSGYLGLSEPVELVLSGDGTLVSDNDSLTISGNEDNGFIVRVVNQATKEVTVNKVLDDPLITQRTFNFTASYELDGVTQMLPAFSILSSKDAAGSYVLTVPVGADLTVSEDTAGFTGIYDTTVSKSGEDGTASSTITLEDVRESEQIVFTNKRKTASISVAKEMSDPTDSTAFTFTAALKNGSTPLENYLVYTTPGLLFGTVEHRTDSAGEISFDLSHGLSLVMTVPVGTVLSVREDAEEFIAQITSTSGTSDSDSVDNQFTFTVSGDDTITFTNAPKGLPVILKKVGYNNTDESIWDLEGVVFRIYTDINKSAASLVTLDGKSEFTSDEHGLLYEGKLPQGTYYLDETGTPAGFVASSGMYVLSVTNSGITLNSTETIGTPDLGEWITSETDSETGITTYTVSIRNTMGFELPHTGGSGTGHFYILGILLTGIAGVDLLMKLKWRTEVHG